MKTAQTLPSAFAETSENDVRDAAFDPPRPDFVEDAYHAAEVSRGRRGFFRALFGDERKSEEETELGTAGHASSSSQQEPEPLVSSSVRPKVRAIERAGETPHERHLPRRLRHARSTSRAKPAFVSVVIPTFDRPEALVRVLDSLDAQIGGIDFEIVVVDNSPNASAHAIVRARASRRRLRCVHEPIPGVSAARNRGVAVARGELVAFIDDDQEADPDWLVQLVECRASHDADAVFGWVEPVLEEGASVHGRFFAAAIERRFDRRSGQIARALVAKLGTGNSLFQRRALGSVPFDQAFATSGGEDSALIRRIANEGGSLVWCREARVIEHVAAARTTLSAVLERRFSAGQLRTRQHFVGAHPSLTRSALVVVAGVVQACCALPLAVLAAPVARSLAVRMLAEVAAGAGKVLFMEPFFVHRYRRPGGTEDSAVAPQSVDAAKASAPEIALSA